MNDSAACPRCKDECVVAVIAETGEEVPIGDNRLLVTVDGRTQMMEHIMKPCSCVSQRRVSKALKHSHIGDEFKRKTFETFNLEGKDQRIRRAFTIARWYAMKFDEVRKSEKHSLGIVGAVGVGKTHLLCAIANHLLSQGVGVRYFNFVTGFKEMFAKYDEGGQAVEDIRHELQTCEVLMLDDLAKGKVERYSGSVDIKKSVFEEIYTIVDYRYFNGLPIIWSSELYETLANNEVLGEATATRLIEKSHIANVSYKAGETTGSMNHRLRVLEESKGESYAV